MDEETWQNVLKRMKYQLQALAMPADIQLGLLPDFLCKADELALDYGHWCLCLLSNDYGKLTQPQRSALTRLDNYFEKISGQVNAHLWTDEAIRTRSEWTEIREMAAELLVIFGWPVEIPAEPI